MAWRGPATRAVLAAVRRPAAAARLHAPRRRVPPAFATTSSPLPSARYLNLLCRSHPFERINDVSFGGIKAIMAFLPQQSSKKLPNNS
ncbi:hypothetical protein ZEAMMB73_Zm00001d030910 [Zea mays]|uniref:Uncharacterized protein n=1 Tax=Zea mays TaxID=4577 RepID=A0A1D6KEZ1_MAIZE|nr:hypothetical protein ZEAMMB73_Zm00001d030910 [Zea mays]